MSKGGLRPLRARGLIYHDVTPPGQEACSGLTAPGANHYKLSPLLFNDHLAALARDWPQGPSLCSRAWPSSGPPPLWLTFDDGGLSAYTTIAPSLEQRGWRGHFLVVSQFLGQAGFMTPAMCRELHERGHVIGSHSASHPFGFGRLPGPELARQWEQSLARLGEVLEAPVESASLPGGEFSRPAALAAARAGVKYLFTSEPVSRVGRLGECLLLGRFAVRAGDPADRAAALARGDWLPCRGQWLGWNTRKLLKKAGGPLYERLRARILG